MTTTIPRPTARVGIERGRDTSASPIPRQTLTVAMRTMTAGDPMVGIRTNGTIRLAMIAPAVFTPRSRPDSDPDSAAVSRRRADAVGKATPSTIVIGRTTRTIEPNRVARVSMRLAGVERPRVPDDGDSPTIASTATRIWVTARTRIGSFIRGARTLNSRAPMAIPVRNVPRMTVKTYVVLPVPDASSRVQVTW